MDYATSLSSHLSPCPPLSLEGRRIRRRNHRLSTQPPHRPLTTPSSSASLSRDHPDTGSLRITLHPSILSSHRHHQVVTDRHERERDSQRTRSTHQRRMIVGSICTHVITTGKSRRKLANYLPLSPPAAVTPGVVSTTTPLTGINPGQPALESHVSLITFSVLARLDLRGFCAGINLH